MIAAGFGFRRAASSASLRAALAATGGCPDILAAPWDKSGAPALVALAEELQLPLYSVAQVDLWKAQTVTCSTASLSARGIGSVSEAAALVAAGPGARLVATRQTSPDRMATCALAEGGAK